MTPIAITSPGTRQTQNLTVPSTQNTAPVLEFRCLYTHDLRRKQKRWQDGLLRFHTFNKRVMVYEVSRNYIGDTHRRDDDVVQDGDEFELDRGVLVQVLEAVGSMEQDLTELLERRRKPKDTNSPGYVAHTPGRDPTSTATTMTLVRSTFGQPSQLRPKSLNALLGTPKGRIGRAAPPIKSPYEQRNENEELENRPAKRQRVEAQLVQPMRPAKASAARVPTPSKQPMGISDGSGNMKVSADKRPQKQQVSVPSKEAIRLPPREAVNEKNRLESQYPNRDWTSKPRAGVPSEDVVEAAQREKTVRSANRHKRYEEAQVRRKARERPPELRDRDIDETPDHSIKHTATVKSSRSIKPSAEPIEIASDIEAAFTKESPKQRMKLQMAARKPRRKLMYRDLLPHDRPVVNRSSSSNSHKERKSRQRSISVRSESQAKDVLADFHQQEQDRLADRLNKANGSKSHEGSRDLFLTQEENETLPAVQHRPKEKTAKATRMSPRRRQIDRPSDQIEQYPRTAEPRIPKTPSTVHDTALTPSKMDAILFPSSRTSPPTRPATPKRIISNTPPPVLKISPDVISHPDHEESPPVTLVPSSPDFQTQASKTPSKVANVEASTPKAQTPKAMVLNSPIAKTALSKAPIPKAPPVENILPKPPSPKAPSPKPPTLPHSAAQPISVPKPASPIHHPFKPPRVRSPLKKSVSDTTNMGRRAPLGATRSTSAASGAQEPVLLPLNDGGTSLWTKEAWDLFGCGRDGVECSYEEFRVKEGLVRVGVCSSIGCDK